MKPATLLRISRASTQPGSVSLSRRYSNTTYRILDFSDLMASTLRRRLTTQPGAGNSPESGIYCPSMLCPFRKFPAESFLTRVPYLMEEKFMFEHKQMRKDSRLR